MKIKVKKLNESSILPAYQTDLAAGFDFHASLSEKLILKSGERFAVPSGLAMEIPAGYVLNIYARSGLAARNGIVMANGVGVIDADYRGEISVLLVNNGKEDFVIESGMRIAQGIILKHEVADWEEVNMLSETARGESGYGSTGVR